MYHTISTSFITDADSITVFVDM